MLHTFGRVLLLLSLLKLSRNFGKIYVFERKVIFVNSLAAFLQDFAFVFQSFFVIKKKTYFMKFTPTTIFFIKTFVILRRQECFEILCTLFDLFSLFRMLVAKFEQMLFYSMAINPRICRRLKISSFYCNFL